MWCDRYKWSLQQDGAPSHTTRNTETCSVRTCSSLSQTFCPRIARIWTRLTCPLGCSDGLPSSKFLLSWQNEDSDCQDTAETTAWRSHCRFITFIIFLFTVNVIRQIAPLFSTVDSNKLWNNVQNEEVVIYAKFGKDLFNISKVIGRKTKWPRFFWRTRYNGMCTWPNTTTRRARAHTHRPTTKDSLMTAVFKTVRQN